MLEGVDLSYANALTNRWPDFIIAKATQGLTKDAKWDQHSANARAWNKPLGAYMFVVKPSRTGGSIAGQVDTFLQVGGNADLFAIDWEGPLAPSKLALRDAIALVQASGRRVGLYASDSVFHDAGQDWDWIAHYGTPTWPTFRGKRADIWQYQGSPLDRDRFDGTVAQLLALGEPPPPDTGTGDDMWFPIRVPGGARAGTVAFAADVELFRLSDGAVNDRHPAYSGVWATSAIHDVPNGSAGFIFTGTTGTTYFIRKGDATFSEVSNGA